MSKRVDGYTLLQKIGKGNYGVVYKATHETKPGQFAVKVIPTSVVNSNSKVQECLINQVEALAKVENCDHIIKYYEMIRTKNNFYFIYEFCNGGNLYDYLQANGPFSENNALKIFRQMVDAFKVLSRMNVLHRDLKPDNIFLHNGKAKLGDFGFCKALKVQESMAKTMLGSPIYMAPEILKGQSYSSKADIWSLGVIMYELLYGNCPFQSNSIAMLVSKIAETEINFPASIEVSQRTKQLIRKMLNKDCVRRSSWVELFNEKIDSEGNYLGSNSQEQTKRREPSPSPLKEMRSAKGISQQKYSFETSFKKQISVHTKVEEKHQNKQNKIKEFQSQKYMDLFAISNKVISNNQVVSSNNKKSRPSIANCTQQLIISNSKKEVEDKANLSKKACERYSECEMVMKLMYQQLQNQNKLTVGYSYLVLCRVHSVFQEICSSLSVHASEYAQFINSLKYEMIQINRQISSARQDIVAMNVTIPLSDETNYELNKKILDFVSSNN